MIVVLTSYRDAIYLCPKRVLIVRNINKIFGKIKYPLTISINIIKAFISHICKVKWNKPWERKVYSS